VPRGGPQLSEQQSTYDQDYYTDWIRAFLDLVERNARSRDGRVKTWILPPTDSLLARAAENCGHLDRLTIGRLIDPVFTPAARSNRAGAAKTIRNN
jgi:hypothetical protein